SWSYTYDNAGRLLSQTDAKGQRTTFTYDAIGRRIQKTTLAGTPQATTANWTYDEWRSGYSNTRRGTTGNKPSAVSTYNYDALGRPVTSSRTIAGATYTTQSGYDAGGRLLWTQYPDGDTVGTPANPIKYDGGGQLYAIPGIVDSVGYDARGNLLAQLN